MAAVANMETVMVTVTDIVAAAAAEAAAEEAAEEAVVPAADDAGAAVVPSRAAIPIDALSTKSRPRRSARWAMACWRCIPKATDSSAAR